jgi:hypothetical protein
MKFFVSIYNGYCEFDAEVKLRLDFLWSIFAKIYHLDWCLNELLLRLIWESFGKHELWIEDRVWEWVEGNFLWIYGYYDFSQAKFC